MKTITIICHEEIAQEILKLVSPLPIDKITIVGKVWRRRTVSVGSRQHRAVDTKGDENE